MIFDINILLFRTPCAGKTACFFNCIPLLVLWLHFGCQISTTVRVHVTTCQHVKIYLVFFQCTCPVGYTGSGLAEDNCLGEFSATTPINAMLNLLGNKLATKRSTDVQRYNNDSRVVLIWHA